VENLPKIQDLVPPLTKLLQSAGKPLSNVEIEQRICELLSIPAGLQQVIHSGNRTELQYRLAWARTSAKGKGLIFRSGKNLWQAK
jgi:restriction system protein